MNLQDIIEGSCGFEFPLTDGLMAPWGRTSLKMSSPGFLHPHPLSLSLSILSFTGPARPLVQLARIEVVGHASSRILLPAPNSSPPSGSDTPRLPVARLLHTNLYTCIVFLELHCTLHLLRLTGGREKPPITPWPIWSVYTS